MKIQNSVFTFLSLPAVSLSNPPALSSNGDSLRLCAFVAIKLCQTKPIFEKPKMNLTPCSTMTNSKNWCSMSFQKQSQTNPIKPNSKSPENGCQFLKAIRQSGQNNCPESILTSLSFGTFFLSQHSQVPVLIAGVLIILIRGLVSVFFWSLS